MAAAVLVAAYVPFATLVVVRAPACRLARPADRPAAADTGHRATRRRRKTQVVLALAILYVRHLLHPSLRSPAATLVAALALSAALLCVALVPMDVLLVSASKTVRRAPPCRGPAQPADRTPAQSDGLRAAWATNATLAALTDSLTAAYYAMYAISATFAFAVLPFAYFFFDENTAERPVRRRACSALKWTLGFVATWLVALLIGLFVSADPPPNDDPDLRWIAAVFTSNRSSCRGPCCAGHSAWSCAVLRRPCARATHQVVHAPCPSRRPCCRWSACWSGARTPYAPSPRPRSIGRRVLTRARRPHRRTVSPRCRSGCSAARSVTIARRLA